MSPGRTVATTSPKSAEFRAWFKWICDVFAGAGWQSWQHRNELWRAMGRAVDAETQSASSRGDLTLDEDLAKSAAFKPKAFFGGELFFELEKRMQAGEMPDIATIKDFYTDVQHIRAGLPAYSIAAFFYAAIFEEEPDSLDFAIYNDPEKYGPDTHHDRGEVLPVMPERAKVVHETIWEVLKSHAHAWGATR